MKQTLLIISFIFFASLEVSACSCSFAWNDSFSRTAKNAEFVALVKIISFDQYLEVDISEHEGKMPYAMTVEIIKKYKGKEQRAKIKILGDNGILCRPYLSDFEINGYYLVSPNQLDNNVNTEYDFFACRTEYLKVDIDSSIAHGKYSVFRNRIDLETFERKLNSDHWDLLLAGSIASLLILTLITLRRNKRNANKMHSA